MRFEQQARKNRVHENKRGEKKGGCAACDLHDNDSPAMYSRWAFNLGSWSSHDGDDAAASSPCRSSILLGRGMHFSQQDALSARA